MAIKEEKRAIDNLVAMEQMLSLAEKADVLLVWYGFKPAAMVEVSLFAKTKTTQEKFLKKVDVFKKILTALGLVYHIEVNYPQSRDEITHYSFVARDADMLKKLMRAYKIKSIERRRIEVGKLLGYPVSAITAFAKKTSIENNMLPARVKKGIALKFLNFRLSKDWRKELAYVYTRALLIKKIAPQLYMQIVKNK